ncbi:MAG TPA: PadR family transcriptional regulator [Candidatus Tumulicola sp.]|jgi:DNA-binding PadR family transcriptional regulator
MKARLLVLGMLHREDLHPYEIKRRFEAAMVDCYLDVDVGSLYYAIRQLEKDGAIEPVARERVARGGIRTIYTLTPKGKAEFQEGFFEVLERDDAVARSLYGPLLFLHCVPRAKVAKALHRKIERLDGSIAELKTLRPKMTNDVSTGGEFLFRHLERQRKLDRAWLAELLADVEAGRVRAGSPRNG